MTTASEVRGASRRGESGEGIGIELVEGEDRDTRVAGRRASCLRKIGSAAGFVIAIGVSSACAPPPALDPTVAVRDIGDGDAEAENEANDAAPAAAKSADPVRWIVSESDGAAQSKAERRPMLVHFAAEWCSACKRMATETFGDPRFQSQAGRFVAVRIDATNDEDPQVEAAFEKYAVLGVPTLIVLDSRGREQRRFTDFIRAEQLLGEINQVR